MGIESIVDVTVSVTGATPSGDDYETPLFLAYHTVGTGANLVDTFASLQEAVTAGHAVGSLVHKGLSAMFSQNPRPKQIKVGKRTTAWAQVLRFYPKNNTAGFVYRFRINGALITYTVLAAQSLSDVAAGIATAVNTAGGSNWSGTHTGTNVYAVMTAAADGVQYPVTEVPYELWMEDVTPAASAAAELTAVLAEDSNWYGLVVDVPSAVTIAAVAAVVETTRKVYTPDTHDTKATDGTVTDDIASTLQGLGYMRTFVQYHPDYGVFSAGALMAYMLTTPPGSATWAHKSIRGVRKYNLRAAQAAALKAKNCNMYLSFAGRGTTLWGVSSGGEYMDVVRGVDWVVSSMQIRVFILLATNPKVPYTDHGVELIKGEVRAPLVIGARAPHNLIVEDSIVVTAPKVADIAPEDRTARVLPNVEFGADLQGAVHATHIIGTLTQ